VVDDIHHNFVVLPWWHLDQSAPCWADISPSPNFGMRLNEVQLVLEGMRKQPGCWGT
jgi:hypothetical protein